MFHIELRQFPNNFCRFNLTEDQLQRTIVGPWAQGEWIELGQRKWNPAQAKLTVLDGPEIPPNQLTMGRGWRNAQRQSREVTERVLGAAAEAARSGDTNTDLKLASDSLGLQLLSDLANERVPLARAWQLACERYPQSTASQSLSLAEGAIVSLLKAELIVLFGKDGAELARIDEPNIQARVGSMNSWTERLTWIGRS